MNPRLSLLIIVLVSVYLVSCGAKKGEPAKPGEKAAPEKKEQEKKEDTQKAETRIRDWLGKELTERMAKVGGEIGKDLGAKLANDGGVMGAAKSLTDAIFGDEQVKKQVDIIADKATAGVGNKITLGWKALTSGGAAAYKKKVKEDTKRVAIEALMDHLKTGVLKDPRMSQLLKDLSPVLTLQTKVAALALQENLSPKVTQKILALALKISAETDKAEMAARMEKWFEKCDDHAEGEVEKLLRAVAGRKSVNDAILNLAKEVLAHERTKKELIVMAQNLLNDSEVHQSLVKVYNAAAFEKGDGEIRKAIDTTIAIPEVDKELFAAMERLATAEGAGPIIAKHLGKAMEDPEIAKKVENFTLAVLEGCGDPLAN